jgi:hypothetical protein
VIIEAAIAKTLPSRVRARIPTPQAPPCSTLPAMPLTMGIFDVFLVTRAD